LWSPFFDSSGMGARGLLLHVLREAAALDHEAVDHAVEDRAVVLAALHVVHEVVHGDRRPGLVERERDVAHRGGELHLRAIGDGGLGTRLVARLVGGLVGGGSGEGHGAKRGGEGSGATEHGMCLRGVKKTEG
jgi:hypothetical protein